MPLWHSAADTFCTDYAEAGARFRLILAEQGTGIVRLGDNRRTFIAPALFCLNEQETVTLEQSRELKAQVVYFYPGVINSTFNFVNIREPHEHFVGTAFQDLELLQAFIHRDDHYQGQLAIGPMSTRRFAALFLALGEELEQQNNGFWPCRSRSYLLEILFVVFRIYSTPPSSNPDSADEFLPVASEEIDPVIMHLHTHYHEKLTIEMLTRLFHTNRTTLEERFREATGTPVMTYLARLRIRIATAMLHDTAIPVGEVADRVGFKDTTHFGRTFRRYMGCSPAEYRQRCCWMLHQ